MCKINALFFPRPAMFCLVPPPPLKREENKGAAIYLRCVFILSADFSDSFPASLSLSSLSLRSAPLPRYLPRRSRARIRLFVAAGVMSRLFSQRWRSDVFCVTVCRAGSCLRGRVFRPWLLLGCLALILPPGPIDYFSSRP